MTGVPTAESIDQTLTRFTDAWNRHDADALAALWCDDGELNHPWGRRAFGRDAIRQLLAEEHAQSMAVSRLTVTNVTTVSTEPNLVAVVEGQIHDVSAPNGRRYTLEHRMTLMLVDAGGEWRIKTLSPQQR